MDEIEIPIHFLCPISMQLMRDPVIVSTGITYDRDNIDKWLDLESFNSITCPVTKQDLSGSDLTPNHTLRRLIQAWCVINSGYGIDRIPTPTPPITKTQILKLFEESKKSTKIQIKCLETLKSITQGSRSNKKCLVDAGGVEFLALILKKNGAGLEKDPDFKKIIDLTLEILCHLQLSDTDLNKLLDSLIQTLEFGDFESRAYAIKVMKFAYSVADPSQLTVTNPEIFTQIIRILHDNVSQQASKTALKLLLELCPCGRNRVKAAQLGTVTVLIEKLLETSEKRVSELILAVLDELCRCAEGRAEFLKHGAGLAVVSKKILRVSRLASEKAVRIISSIAKYSTNSRVLQEMMQVGVVAKLCLVLQVESKGKIVDKTREILMLHSRVWKDSPCIPSNLFYYPSY